MKQKILALLKAKYSGVRADVLAQLSASLALTVTTDDEAQALVDRITDAQVTEFTKEYRKEVDAEVSNANKTFETNLKKKFDFVEKSPSDPPNPPAPPTGGDPPANPEDMAAVLAKAIAEANKPILEQLNALKAGETQKSRLEKLQQTLSAAPELFRENTLKNFNRMKFESDDDFDSYITDTTDDLAKFQQSTADEGLKKFGTPQVGGNQTQGKEVSDATKAYLDAKSGKSASELGGKEV